MQWFTGYQVSDEKVIPLVIACNSIPVIIQYPTAKTSSAKPSGNNLYNCIVYTQTTYNFKVRITGIAGGVDFIAISPS